MSDLSNQVQDIYLAVEATREALARRIEGPLPQRVVDVDTGETADEYSLRLSAVERNMIVRALRRE